MQNRNSIGHGTRCLSDVVQNRLINSIRLNSKLLTDIEAVIGPKWNGVAVMQDLLEYLCHDYIILRLHVHLLPSAAGEVIS